MKCYEQHPAVSAYLEAVKKNLPVGEVELLRRLAYEHLSNDLGTIESRYQDNDTKVNQQKAFARGEKKALYQAMINDYRRAQTIAKLLSNMKKEIRTREQNKNGGLE